MKRILNISLTFFFLTMTAIFVPIFAGGIFADLTVHQSMIIGEIMYVVAALAVTALLDRSLIGQIQQNSMTPRVVLLVLLVGFLIEPIATWLNMFSMLFVRNYVVSGMTAMGTSVLMNLLYAALAPAVAEEFVFRGILFHGSRHLGVLKAALICGLMFGLLHMNLNQFVYAFALGVLLALVVEASGSIYAAMMVHFMLNAESVMVLAAAQRLSVTGVLSETAGEMSAAEILPGLLVYTPIALVCCAGIFFLLRSIARHSGRGEYFDLVLHGQERRVFRPVSRSEEEVRSLREELEHTGRDILKEDEAGTAGTEDSPVGKARKFAPKEDPSLERMSRQTKILVALPALVGMIGCIIYMFWIEMH